MAFGTPHLLRRVLPGLLCTLPLALLLTFPPGLSAQDRPVDQAELEADEPWEVGTALPPVEPGTQLMTLTLDEAIDIALENNLDIRSIRLQPQIQQYNVRQARAAFNPSLSATLSHNNQTNQSTSQLDGGQRITQERNTMNLSFNQPSPWMGGSLSASFNNSRTSTDNIFATRDPSYSSSFSLNYSQPLLSGRRIDNQRNQLRTTEVQREITDIQVQAQVDQITQQVRSSYWSLRSQIEQIEIQRRSLEQARQLLENNKLRVEQGTMVEMDLAQAEAQVASAEQSLLNAEIQWRTGEMNFKRLLASGADDPIFTRTLNPVDLPTVEEVDVDIETAIDRGLRFRPDIMQQTRQRQISEMDLEVTRDNARPDLNLSASYSLSGVGGDLFEREGLGGEPVLVAPGGYSDAISAITNFDTPTFNVSLSFSYPIGTRSQQLALERSRLQLRQTEMALESQELQITTEVTNAGMAVRNAWLQLQAATRSREAAERSAEAELTRFNVGASTNFQVVTAQDNLTQQRLSELQAIISYINAIANFEEAQGTRWADDDS